VVRKPDILAPGENIRTTEVTTNGLHTGTSLAAPHIAGTAALAYNITGLQPSATSPLHVRTILIHATDIAKDACANPGIAANANRQLPAWTPEWGWGVLNAEKAVEISLY